MKVAEVVEFVRTEEGDFVRVDTGGGTPITAEHYAPSGDDSPPLPGDFAALEKSNGRGNTQATGYRDPANANVGLPGEKRYVARDENKQIVGTFHMKRDGSFELSLKSGTKVTIDAEGAVLIDSTNVTLCRGGSRRVVRQGDPVAGVAPKLICGAPGTPALPALPTALTPTGDYVVVGQNIGGQPNAKA